MYIKTLDGKKILNSNTLTSIEISEPKFDQKKWCIYAKTIWDGGLLAEAETEAKAIEKLNNIMDKLNGVTTR